MDPSIWPCSDKASGQREGEGGASSECVEDRRVPFPPRDTRCIENLFVEAKGPKGLEG